MKRKRESKKAKEPGKKSSLPTSLAFSQFRRGSLAEKLAVLPVISSTKHPRTVPFLEEVVYKTEDKIEIKIKAAELLGELGKPIREDFFRSLKTGGDLQQELFSFAKLFPPGESKEENFTPIVKKFLVLEPLLQKILLKQLTEEFPEKSLEIIASLIGKQEELDRIIAKILGSLPAQGAADLLGKMLDTKNKVVWKEVKRALFRLEREGIFSRTRSEKGTSVLRRLSSSEPEGFLSPIDGMGNRFVWLVLPNIPRGQYLFFAILNEVKGITSFSGGEITRRGVKKYLEKLKIQKDFVMVEADPSYCRFLIKEGYQNTTRSENTLPQEYLTWRKVVTKDLPEKPLPLIYRYYDAEEIKTNRLFWHNIEKLRGISELKGWFLEKEELGKHLTSVMEAKESKIILSELQKKTWNDEMIKKAVDEIFDGKRRSLFKRRLEEMAYLFMKLGREEDAKLTLVAALKLDEIPPASHPFLVHLVEKSISLFIEEEDRQKKENPPLIIKP